MNFNPHVKIACQLLKAIMPGTHSWPFKSDSSFFFFSNICLQFILVFLNNIHICKQQDVGFSPNPQFLTSVCSHTLARTAICFLVAKPCPALLYSMDGCTLDSPWDFPSKGTGVGCHFLLQGTLFFVWEENKILQSRDETPMRGALTWAGWRMRECAGLLLVLLSPPVLGETRCLVAGYLETSEAGGGLSLSRLLGSAAHFGGAPAQRPEPVSSWEKGFYWALWFALEPERKWKKHMSTL